MENKDILLILLGLLGWIWGIVQYILIRRNQKLDKLIDKRFEVYSSFMNKADEISQNMQSDLKMLYGISNDFMAKILMGNEKDTNQALLDFNSELIENMKRSLKPIMIINHEMNKLKLVCSASMLPKIKEYKKLANDFSDEFQIVLNNISISKDINITIKQLTNLGHNQRNALLAKLWKEIEKMMRNELGLIK